MPEWMKHPLNSRDQQNVARMMMKQGMAGYGAFWALNELLMGEPSHVLEADYNVLGYRLHCDSGLVKSVASEFGLYVFTDDGEYMHSEQVDDWASHIEETSSKRSAAGKRGASKRWESDSKVIANAKQSHSNAMANDGKAMAGDSRLDKTKTKTRDIKPSRPKSATRIFAEDSEEYKSALYLWRHIQANNPDYKAPDLQKWADDLRLMHERDNRSWDKINRMIDWCQADDFWQANILSPAKLRKQYDQMAAKANANAKQSKQSYGRPHRQEDTPAWMHPGYTPESKPATPESKASINAGLDQLKAMREARANASTD